MQTIKTPESLCGTCNVPGNVSMRTFSLDMKRYYCVKCLHMWAYREIILSSIVNLSLIERSLKNGDVEWDGLSATQALINGRGEHYERIMNADLDYPIFVNNDYVILDGRHRFAKSKYVEKNTFIRTCMIPDEALEEIYSFTKDD